jgi:hypothetical protein
MQLPKRKTQLQRLRSTVTESVARTIRKIPIHPSGRTVKIGALAAGGITGLTAASAAISSRRQRSERSDEES